jgi:acyl-ACP thioesterase
METQTTVEYEVIIPETNKRFFTRSRDEALDYYEREWIVYERHITMGNPSQFVQAQQIVTIAWNNNPEFEGE